MDLGYLLLAIGLLGLVFWLALRGRTSGSPEVDPRVSLGEDGFGFEDPLSPTNDEIHYEVELAGGARRRGSFVLGTPKVWVYTGEKPIDVRILGASPAGRVLSAPSESGLPPIDFRGVGKPSPKPRPAARKSPVHGAGQATGVSTSTGYQPPGEWSGSFGSTAVDYPETYSETTAGADYQGGGGETGGGGSSVSWDNDSAGSSWDSGSSSGDASSSSAY